jgi:hypothetical protein
MISPGLAARWRAGQHAPTALRACPKRRGRTPLSGHGSGNRDRRATAWAARGGAAGLVVALMTLTIGACSSGPPSAHLPPKATQTSAPSPASPSPASPSPNAASAPTAKAAVTAYLALWPAGDRAEQAGEATQARAILASVATPAYIQVMVHGMAPFWRRHEVARGHMVDHITAAHVFTGTDGNLAAVVVDCQNASHHQVARIRSGHLVPVPGSRGPAHARLYASLTYSHGRWLVQNITFTGNRC